MMENGVGSDLSWKYGYITFYNSQPFGRITASDISILSMGR
jgi:hypothetical protein